MRSMVTLPFEGRPLLGGGLSALRFRDSLLDLVDGPDEWYENASYEPLASSAMPILKYNSVEKALSAGMFIVVDRSKQASHVKARAAMQSVMIGWVLPALAYVYIVVNVPSVRGATSLPLCVRLKALLCECCTHCTLTCTS